MGTLSEDLNTIKGVEDTLTSNKVANFAYTDAAYAANEANGVETYNPNRDYNIPVGTPSVMKVNSTVLQRGWRAQASSITRMLMNHFLGRLSYNLNKANDNISSLLSTLISHSGTANGFATLDADGRIPYSQLPESALEYKGEWNASTNTPTLADGTGTLGDMYIVSVAGTQNLGHGSIDFLENDRVIYNGSVWQKLAGGNVRTVNGVSPDGSGNISVSGSDIPVQAAVQGEPELDVTLRDKTLVHVYCKGQAAAKTKVCLGSVPGNLSSRFLISFDTDNTYQGIMELTFSDGPFSGYAFKVELNENLTSVSNYNLKAGTYIARIVQTSSTPIEEHVLIESEYDVASAREASCSKAEFNKIYGTSLTTVSGVKYFTLSEDISKSINEGSLFLVNFSSSIHYAGDKLRIGNDEFSLFYQPDLERTSADGYTSSGTYYCQVKSITASNKYITLLGGKVRDLLLCEVNSFPASSNIYADNARGVFTFSNGFKIACWVYQPQNPDSTTTNHDTVNISAFGFKYPPFIVCTPEKWGLGSVSIGATASGSFELFYNNSHAVVIMCIGM